MSNAPNHGKLLLQRLHQQREMDFLCDVTIVVRDVEFRAHRNVLAAFSKYFSSQAEKGQEVTALDPDKVSRYALEKLLEFTYTGQMNVSSTRQAAVRQAAVFLGMSDAIKYLGEIHQLSEAGKSSQTDTAASPRSPSSPVPLSIDPLAEEWAEGGEASKDQGGEEPEEGQDLDEAAEAEEEGAGSDEEYTPRTPSAGGRGQGRKRGRPRSVVKEEAEAGGSADVAPKIHGYRGRGRRGRGRGRGQSRGRGRGGGKSREEASAEDSDASVKDFGDDSADWSPSQAEGEEDAASKKPRLSSAGRGRGRGRRRGRGRGRGGGRRRNEEEEESGSAEGGAGEEEEEEEGGEQEASAVDELSLFCTECNKAFKDASSLRRHEKIHKGLKPFVCIFCSKTFRQATQLKTHLRIHTGEKPFGCTDCDKCFAQKCQLVAHRRMHHGEEKPYTCERCGFKFATSSNYKIHIRLHSGEKPYVCDICGQAFAQSSTLTYHKRRHTGEKPYQCDLCGMSFSVSSSLIAHARKHTGETPYKCSIPQCDARFVTSSELKKHIRRLHPEGNSGVQCLLCGNRFASVKNMIKHQEKAHADEVRQHKERARAVVLLASSHPVAFVQSKLSQDTKALVSIPESEPANPEPATPAADKAPPPAQHHGAAGTETIDPSAIMESFKVETEHTPVTFDPEQEQTINSDTLHALVEQLRPPASPASLTAPASPAQSLEQIVIIRTVDTPDATAPQ